MNRIKFLREGLNITQQELADKLECSKSIIGNYENDRRKPSLEVLVKLSEIFNCSIDYILGKSDIRNIEEEFDFAYHKEMEGLSKEEIKEAVEFYKKIKYGDNKEKNK